MDCWFSWKQNEVWVTQQMLKNSVKNVVLKVFKKWFASSKKWFSSVHLKPELEYDNIIRVLRKALKPVFQAGYMAHGLLDNCKPSSWKCTSRVSSHALANKASTYKILACEEFRTELTHRAWELKGVKVGEWENKETELKYFKQE